MHKHANHEYKHITLTKPLQTLDKDYIVTTLFAGINTAPNHTRVEQPAGWLATVQEVANIYNAIPLGEGHNFELCDFTT